MNEEKLDKTPRKQRATVGRIVMYVLGENDVAAINRRREDANRNMDMHRSQKTGVMVHAGNEVTVGQSVAALVVHVWDEDGTCVNLKCFLDGTDELWVTGISHGDDPIPYSWHWPPRA